MKRSVGGVIHTYQRFDPTKLLSPTQPPPDLVSPAFEHMLMYGSMRELTDEVSISLFDQHGPATVLPCENGLVIQQAWFSRFRILQLQRDVCGVAEC